jgi:hypothetical protein
MGLMEKMPPQAAFCGKPIHNPGPVCYIYPGPNKEGLCARRGGNM